MLVRRRVLIRGVGLDKTEWRDALPVRQPRTQGAPGSHNGGHAGASGSGRVQHERHSSCTSPYISPILNTYSF